MNFFLLAAAKLDRLKEVKWKARYMSDTQKIISLMLCKVRCIRNVFINDALDSETLDSELAKETP